MIDSADGGTRGRPCTLRGTASGDLAALDKSSDKSGKIADTEAKSCEPQINAMVKICVEGNRSPTYPFV